MKNLTLIHSQRNDSCVICGTEFKPRAGKQYCSNACKQKGYFENKQQVTFQQEKEQEIKAIQKKFQFCFTEYRAFNKKYPDNVSNIQMYCFFRKNLIGNLTIDDIFEYINSFRYCGWFDEFWENEDSPARKKYKEFEAKYFGDEVVISFSEQAPKGAKSE